MEQLLCSPPFLTIIDDTAVVGMEEDDDPLREDNDFADDNASNIANVGSSPLGGEKEDVQHVGLAILINESEKLKLFAYGMEEEHYMAAKKHDYDDEDDISSSSSCSGKKGKKEYA
eukprot:11317552-Ditylum_brightwellii.AAC.1